MGNFTKQRCTFKITTVKIEQNKLTQNRIRGKSTNRFNFECFDYTQFKMTQKYMTTFIFYVSMNFLLLYHSSDSAVFAKPLSPKFKVRHNNIIYDSFD